MALALANRMLSAVFFPLSYLRSQLRKPFDKFIESRSGPFSGAVELNSSRVYILPTRVGVIFGLLLILLLLGSINYTKSLGFMLTFLLASVGNVGMLMTWKNLAGLRVSGQGAMAVFAGQSAVFSVQLENHSADKRYAITISSKTQTGDTIDIQPSSVATLHFRQPTEKRGYLNPGRIRLKTEFPMGLFVAWTWVDLSMHCLVYPELAGKSPKVSSSDTQSGEDLSDGLGLEDFAGLRKFQQGDSWRRVSWKTAARMDELYSKEFTGGQPELQWIDWLTIDESSQEARLSLMTRMVVDAQQAGRHYGLRLPNVEIMPDSGKPHQHRCLKALALYRLEEH
jgi:uncharacterized protein (DUF58 family)